MTRERLDGLYLLLLGSLLFVLVGSFMERMGPGSMEDFEAVYYSSQCLLQHCDPYNESELLHLYLAEGGERSSDPLQRGQRQSVALCINLPTTVIFASPFAMLAWGPAHALWMIFTAGIFILAAFLAWDIGANHAPRRKSLAFWMITSRLTSEMALVSGMLLGADFDAVLREAALLNAAVAGQRAQALFLEDLAGGVVVEELDLGDGGRADEAGVLVELRADFHAAGAGDAVGERVVGLLLLGKTRGPEPRS
jgi:hypothetical protein